MLECFCAIESQIDKTLETVIRWELFSHSRHFNQRQRVCESIVESEISHTFPTSLFSVLFWACIFLALSQQVQCSVSNTLKSFNILSCTASWWIVGIRGGIRLAGMQKWPATENVFVSACTNVCDYDLLRISSEQSTLFFPLISALWFFATFASALHICISSELTFARICSTNRFSFSSLFIWPSSAAPLQPLATLERANCDYPRLLHLPPRPSWISCSASHLIFLLFRRLTAFSVSDIDEHTNTCS